MIRLIPYNPSFVSQWNQVVDSADNNHFMFHRAYMEYHSDRFKDASYVIFNHDELIGVIPGSKDANQWYSHQGLTFGGIFMYSKRNRVRHYLDVYGALFTELRSQGYVCAHVKPVPSIYHINPSENDLYALNSQAKAEHFIEISTAVDLRTMPKASELRARSKKKAEKNGLFVEESIDFEPFWNILGARLDQKYGRKPVHTVEEIKLLKSYFFQNIFLYIVRNQRNEVCGGSVLFTTATVDHAQYIAATQEGMEQGALDLLFFTLINNAKVRGKRFFDFGISTEQNGKFLNESLVSFKEGFGGRGIVHHKIVATL